MTVMAAPREYEDLWDAQEKAGGTTCQLNPSLFDAPTYGSRAALEQGARIAKEFCRSCPAFKECRVVADLHPEVTGVVAGYVRYPSPKGPRSAGANREQENRNP